MHSTQVSMLNSALTRDKDYKGLIVYQKALVNTVKLFKFYKNQKPLWSERFVIEQLLRAHASVCANIVEGYGRNNRGDYKRFLDISRGSALEAEYWIELIFEIRPLDKEILAEVKAVNKEVIKMLTVLIRHLRV